MTSLKEMLNRSKCCIIGIPDHQGVINVGGRVGAARGPSLFRRAFLKLNGRFPIHERVQDLGDVKDLQLDVAANHRRAADWVREGHHAAGSSIVVGGGHDHGFSHLLGLSEALKNKFPRLRLGCINLDAHLDVRKPSPRITSGSPFYLAIEAGILHPEKLVEFGIQSHCNAPELWAYVESKNVKVIPFNEIRENKAVLTFKKTLKKLSSVCDAIAISFDLDAVAESYSPGVSSPQSEGFTSSEIIQMMEIAGKEGKVVSLGIFELNPEHDTDGKSTRLAATAAYHFIESRLF